MYIPKRYGQSKAQNCPFCDKPAVVRNKQGIPVCSAHKDKTLDSLKCACGSWLDVKVGRYGPYCTCIKCGNVNFKRALDLKENA